MGTGVWIMVGRSEVHKLLIGIGSASIEADDIFEQINNAVGWGFEEMEIYCPAEPETSGGIHVQGLSSTEIERLKMCSNPSKKSTYMPLSKIKPQ